MTKVVKSLVGYDTVLLDLDDTLITSEGKFPEGIWDMRFNLSLFKYLRTIEGLKHIGIITNQGGIEAGFVNEDSFLVKLNYIIVSLSEFLKGKEVLAYYCDSNDRDNLRRKPNIGMFEDFIIDADISLSSNKIVYVGDASGEYSEFETFSDSDYQFAVNCGIDYCDINSLTFDWTSKCKH